MPLKKFVFVAILAAFVGLTGERPVPAADESAVADETALKNAKIGTTPPELIAFLRKQVLPDKERAAIEALVLQLGDESFPTREEASDKLVRVGVTALPFLRKASRSSNREVSHRALQSLEEIGAGPDPALEGAAVRALVRQAPAEAVAALLDYYPFAAEDWVEDEVLTALGTLGVRAGKVDAALLAALKDPLPARRGAAACVLGRWADLEQRAAVRRMLADPDFTVRAQAARGLLGDRYSPVDVPLNPEDRKTVKEGNVGADAAGLVAFFRKRTLSEEDQKQLAAFVRKLDSDVFKERQEAAKMLVESGTPALAYLRPALKGNSVEMTRRVEECIKKIEKGPGPALPMAAARLLARRHPAEAIQVLLAYVPFADDNAVEEEVLNALAQLSIQDPQVPGALATALKDELPARRAAAALVLGLVGGKEECAALRPLLKDSEPPVRLRAAQGLLCAKDKEAVPVLLALLGDGPMTVAAQAEDLLRQVGGEKGPLVSINEAGADARKKGHEAWTSWWRDHGDKLTLAGPLRDRPYLNITLVAELSGGKRGNNHRVWEFGPDGKVRWEMNEPFNPIDAQILPGNRLLVAEYNGQKVTERDIATKKILWEKRTNSIVVSCQRLSNGNTFIATYNTGVLEVKPDGKEVYTHNPVANFSGIVNAIKMRNNTIAIMSAQGELIEIDTAGKKLRTTKLDNNGGWNGVEELPGGRLLICIQSPGKVQELDSARKKVWECSVQGAVHAIRLPNGNTLVACGNNSRLVEVDRAGKEVWKKDTGARPFHVRRR
jgi:HEAT repeat protein